MHRIARLRRQGERYFTDGLRDITGDRRLAILAVCTVEWRGAIADAVVETHDRVVGQTFRSQTFRSAQRRCDARIQDSRTVLHDTLAAFRTLGAALLEAKGDGPRRLKRPSRLPAAGRSSKALSLRLSS